MSDKKCETMALIEMLGNKLCVECSLPDGHDGAHVLLNASGQAVVYFDERGRYAVDMMAHGVSGEALIMTAEWNRGVFRGCTLCVSRGEGKEALTFYCKDPKVETSSFFMDMLGSFLDNELKERPVTQ